MVNLVRIKRNRKYKILLLCIQLRNKVRICNYKTVIKFQVYFVVNLEVAQKRSVSWKLNYLSRTGVFPGRPITLLSVVYYAIIHNIPGLFLLLRLLRVMSQWFESLDSKIPLIPLLRLRISVFRCLNLSLVNWAGEGGGRTLVSPRHWNLTWNQKKHTSILLCSCSDNEWQVGVMSTNPNRRAKTLLYCCGLPFHFRDDIP